MMNVNVVFRWLKEFQMEKFNLEDADKTSRTRKSFTKENIIGVKEMLDEDR